MFKFDFIKNDESKQDDSTITKQITCLESKEVILERDKYQIGELITKCMTCGDVILQYVSPDEVLFQLKEADEDNCILRADTSHSDLIAGDYEGGLKIWECTIDLINFLIDEKILFTNKKVLDLGCGAGLLGIYSILKGAVVDFQDYNVEVVEHTTIPNVLLNTQNNERNIDNCRFYCGDWKYFQNLVIDESIYDIILTSETIYNSENYNKLINIFKCLLKDDGVVYLAAKTYYFGVGGSIRQFEKLVKRELFNCSIAWKNCDGVQREILKICKP